MKGLKKMQQEVKQNEKEIIAIKDKIAYYQVKKLALENDNVMLKWEIYDAERRKANGQ
jgi:hypothetical protein